MSVNCGCLNLLYSQATEFHCQAFLVLVVASLFISCYSSFLSSSLYITRSCWTWSFQVYLYCRYTLSCFQVKVDMGEPILSGPDIPTKLPATKNKAVVQAELAVEGLTWHVTCVSMGNPHCVTFGTKESKVIDMHLYIVKQLNRFHISIQTWIS